MMPLRVLYERYSDLVFRTAREILHDDGEAEEMVEKVFMVIFRDGEPVRSRSWNLQNLVAPVFF